MTPNHAPVSPLPWAQIQGTSLIVVAKDGTAWVAQATRHARGASHRQQQSDAAYIVHAANLYPTLIAALKELRDLVPGYDDARPDDPEPQMFDLIEATLAAAGEGEPT